MTIEPKISNYIDIAIERERIIFNKENSRHMGALKESFQHEVQMLAELIKERSTREETRLIAREEIVEALLPVNSKLDFLNEERKLVRRSLKKPCHSS
jgi:hypothetical protein